jgi:Ran GTPase-activating protein (RanGAP) involved in mRNA processing and transport
MVRCYEVDKAAKAVAALPGPLTLRVCSTYKFMMHLTPAALRGLLRENVIQLLANCDPLREAGVVALAQALRTNTTLTVLDVAHARACAAGAVALADALRVNRTLTWLSVHDNALCWNGDEGAAALADALRVNNTLKTLLMGSNNIGAGGATALCEALRENAALTAVDLRGNHGAAQCFQMLTEMQRQHTTLTDLGVDDYYF